jgi:hypothetical protein
MRWTRDRIAFVTIAAVLPVSAPALAQQPPPVHLDSPNAELAAGFTYISSIRELRDGRVILTDPREQRVVVVDFSEDSAAPIGRRGEGPREWSNAMPLHPLSADSSLQVDASSRRWLLYAGDRIVRTIPPDAPVVLATRGDVSDVDGRGHVFRIVAWRARPGLHTEGAGDSLAVVRYSRDDGTADTVALLRDWPATVQTVVGPDGSASQRLVARPAFAVGEEMAAFPDGWLAIARLDPYRVDWLEPDGKVVRGSPLPVPRVRVDEHERRAYLARTASARAALDRAPPEVRDAFMRMYTDFPAFIPPFQGDALIAGGDGRLYIRRTRTAEITGVLYDVVDRRGVLNGQIGLKDNERIAAVGVHSLYVVWTDDVDLEHLRRYALPLAGSALPR